MNFYGLNRIFNNLFERGKDFSLIKQELAKLVFKSISEFLDISNSTQKSSNLPVHQSYVF